MRIFPGGLRTIATIVACSLNFCVPLNGTAVAASGIPEEVSVIELKIRPGRYSGQEILVSGYLSVPLRPMIFLTKEHAKMLDMGNAILIEHLADDAIGVSGDSCKDKYVQLRGTVQKSKKYKTWVIKDVRVIFEYDMSKPGTASTKGCWPLH